MKFKKLIIFDFDGTIINSIPDLTEATNIMLKHYNLPLLTIEQTTPFIGNGAKALVKRSLQYAKKQNELNHDFLEEAFKFYISAYKKVTCNKTFLYPNVIDTLIYLKDKNYKMAICTNKPFDFVEPILDKLKIKSYFDLWIGEESLSTKKPDAAPLLYLVDKIGATIQDSVMVGDSKNDILAAKNAKMDSLGVSYGYNYNENIADYNPTVIVDDFSELKNIF